MQNYRQVLETLYTIRGRKSGRTWIEIIDGLEINADNVQYVEASPYLLIINLKKQMFFQINNMVSHRFIKNYIENSVKYYDENYIGEIGNLFCLVDMYSDIEECSNCQLLKDFKKKIEYS